MKENKKDQLNEDLKKIILSYCEFPDNTWTLEFYRADIVNMISEIKDTMKKDIVDEQLQKIILSYCEFPDNTYTLEFYRSDIVNMIKEIKEICC